MKKMTGGELPAMVIIDAVARMLPNVLGAADSAQTEIKKWRQAQAPEITRRRRPDLLGEIL